MSILTLQMLLPRVSYFPFIYDKLENVYGGIVGKSIEETIWLSFGSTPLKWWEWLSLSVAIIIYIKIIKMYTCLALLSPGIDYFSI